RRSPRRGASRRSPGARARRARSGAGLRLSPLARRAAADAGRPRGPRRGRDTPDGAPRAAAAALGAALHRGESDAASGWGPRARDLGRRAGAASAARGSLAQERIQRAGARGAQRAAAGGHPRRSPRQGGAARGRALRGRRREAANRWYALTVRGASGRQVRQLFERQGALVSRVLRTQLGPVMLERTLARGRFRELTQAERRALLPGPAAPPGA